MAEKIIEHSAISMYEQDQCKYSIVVNRRRAIPEVRDGLIPVQRRILFGAFKDGQISPNKKDKSASLVGTVMRLYHPHGDSSIYGAISTLVNWFKSKMPLMYGKGNWGNVSGDAPAAQRYTECALSNFGYDIMIDELAQSKNIVDWIDTYKRNGDKEPEFLPAKIPLILVNGAFGIGVGMSINVPSHNLVEVLNAVRVLLKDPTKDIVLIPDLCQKCTIIDTDWESISKSGRGKFKVRGNIETEVTKKGNVILHITSLPDDVSTTSVYEKILSMVEAKQMPMIKDIFNVLSNEKPNITIHLKPGSDPEYVKQAIYAKTDVQKSMTINFEAVSADGIEIKDIHIKNIYYHLLISE